MGRNTISIPKGKIDWMRYVVINFPEGGEISFLPTWGGENGPFLDFKDLMIFAQGCEVATSVEKRKNEVVTDIDMNERGTDSNKEVI